MPLSPRREASSGPIPCSAYTLECKLLRAYGHLYQEEVASIWHPATRKARAVHLLGGQLAPTQIRYAEARLAEAMPELIRRLTLKQQPQVAALLLADAPDLGQVVALLVKLERNLNYRDEDLALKKDDDDWKAKALGLGKFRPALAGTALQQRQKKQARLAAPLGPPLELTPWVPKQPAVRLRTKKKAGGRRRRAVARAQQAVQCQLCFEFPGGGVTLASL